MLARTRTHHIENMATAYSTIAKKKNWRDIFKSELEIHVEQGLYLKGLRLREGYTQANLGDLIGISPNNISAMEHGRRPIGKDVRSALS